MIRIALIAGAACLGLVACDPVSTTTTTVTPGTTTTVTPATGTAPAQVIVKPGTITTSTN